MRELASARTRVLCRAIDIERVLQSTMAQRAKYKLKEGTRVIIFIIEAKTSFSVTLCASAPTAMTRGT